jgi:hypothetical protein
LVGDDILDVSDIIAKPGDVDPNLEKELDIIQHMLIQGENVEVRFTPYLSNSRKKKIRKASYQT